MVLGFGEEKLFNFERTGSFGRFYSGESFPIEYILTTLFSAELSDLTFARDIHPEEIDFELLMQRDIDEERVRIEMEPYLNPDPQEFTLAELRARSVFFPPLLAAIVPTTGKTMEAYYRDEKCELHHHNNEKFITREWPGLFKLTYHHSNNLHAYKFKMPSGENDQMVEVGVRHEPVKIEISLTKGEEYGAKLVIIDGQHRLFTLIQVYGKHAKLLQYLGIPVCILFAPNATTQKNQENYPHKIPTVPEVFRHLFVDVNNTAKQVGGHFNILLSDNNLSCITCRKFCDYILKTRGTEGLAVIEWNTKTQKDSAKITRSYSLTSIGIINKALSDSMTNRKLLFNYVLKLDEVAEQLNPDSNEGDSQPELKWNKFSLSQKDILETQIKTFLVPCLDLIFFTAHEFATAFDIFCTELNNIKVIADSKQPENKKAQQALNQVLDYMPISKGKSFEGVRSYFQDFESKIKGEKDVHISVIIQYALFQRAIIEAWAQVLDAARIFVPDPRNATKGFVKLLDLALHERGHFFVYEQLYMQHTVFMGSQIIVRQETRKILTYLLIVHLINPFNVQQICGEMGVTGSDLERCISKLRAKGRNAAKEIPKFYEVARKKTFKANYRVYLSINGNEREELVRAEEEQKRHSLEVKEGKRTETEVSDRFDILVNKYVKADIELATETLTNNLHYPEIEDLNSSEEEEVEEENS